MSEQVKAALRSFATTFFVLLLAAVPVAQAVEGDWSWVGAVAGSALIGALRTLLVALNPLDDSYGLGSEK